MSLAIRLCFLEQDIYNSYKFGYPVYQLFQMGFNCRYLIDYFGFPQEIDTSLKENFYFLNLISSLLGSFSTLYNYEVI